MRFEKTIKRLIVILFIAAAVGGCQPGPGPAPSAEEPTSTPFPTSVPSTATTIPTLTPTLRPSSTPLPTLTLAPSLTPVPTRTPTPGIIGIGVNTGPFRDDFSDPGSGWPTENGSDWGFGYYEGGYRMYNNIGYAEVCASRTRSNTDIVIEVDVTKLSGANNAYFGVTCRKTGPNYYSLTINGNGEYNILKTTGGIPELLTSGENGAIRKGNQTNKLVASCIGNVLTLTVNGVEVVSHTDVGPLFGTFIGLVLGTTSEPGVEVKFDNFNSFPADNAAPIPSLTPTGTLTVVPTATATP